MIVAELSAQDVAVLLAVGVSLAAAVAIALVTASLLRTVRALRDELAEFRRRSDEVLGELHVTVDVARADLDRVDDLVGSAEALAATVDGVAKVGYLTVGKPVIKTVALAKGTSRAARRIRGTKAG
jgi:hypothetical protein